MSTREPMSYAGLLDGGWRDRAFEPFADGVEISRLYDDGPNGAAAALLRYAPGARVALHRHTGNETIFVLEGSQRDENGLHKAGTVVVNPPGSRHSVHSAEGCVILICWERPIVFEEDAAGIAATA